jgi:hypothetical protein
MFRLWWLIFDYSILPQPYWAMCNDEIYQDLVFRTEGGDWR